MSTSKPHAPKPDLTSWAVVDSQGHLNEASSHLAHMREDPASTTKLWTLYTILTGMKNGTIDKDFLIVHGDDAERMMTRSDNSAAIRLAKAAGGSVEAFTATMTQLAHQKGMLETQFNTPCGMPQAGQYSTAADMALAVVRFHQDFPKRVNWLKETHYAGVREHGCVESKNPDDEQCTNTNRQMLGQHDIVGGKTGTGNSEFDNGQGGKGYGSPGRLAFVGITGHSHGGFAVLGANTRDERNRTAFAAADALNTLPDAPPVPQSHPRFEVAHVENHAAAPQTPQTPHTPSMLETAMNTFASTATYVMKAISFSR